ncbi:MAG: hypothetical protein WC746_03070 [archaeon]|jgi:hypothetical protein
MPPHKPMQRNVLRNALARYNLELKQNGQHHRDTILAQAALFEVAIKKLQRKKEKIISLRKSLLAQGHTIGETQQLRMESRYLGEQIENAKLTLKEVSKKLLDQQ